MCRSRFPLATIAVLALALQCAAPVRSVRPCDELTIGSAATGETPPADPQRIAQLIAELNAEDFSTRQSAHEALVKIGEPALPLLHAAARSDSAEVRFRADAIIRELQHRALLAGFRRMGQTDDERIDLDEGMWLIARILDPLSRREELDRRLDELAAGVRKRLGEGVDPRTAPPREVVDAVVHVVFVDEGFTGNRADYDNPHNSSLAHVLEQKKGLPILLSHLVVSVGERLEVPLVGLQVPSRYMLKYDGAKAPKGQPADDIVIDAYGDGKILTLDELKALVPSFDPATHLAPSSRRATLTRMLRNLANDLQQAGRHEEAQQVERYLLLCDEAIPAAP
jgi:regulator of sirC expression with transglutaminase-like and TPR domain